VTSLHNLNERFSIAIKQADYKIVKGCLHSGISLAYTDWAGCTALHHVAAVAECDDSIEVAKTLLRFGANLNAFSKLKKTPLHLACQNGNNEIIKLFVESKGDISSQDILLMTPLHWIASCKNLQECTLEAFFSRIKDNMVDFKDKFNRTCIDIAREQENWSFLRNINSFRSNEHFKIMTDFIEIDQPNFIPQQRQSKSGPLFKSNQKIRKTYETLLTEIDSDDSETDFRQGLESFKKKKISSSPIQNIEDTLTWLQNQAIANTSDDFILEDKEFYLTEAGVLTLDYINKIDPIGDEQRLLLKIAKDLEPNEDKAKTSSFEQDLNIIDDFTMNHDWIFGDDFG